MTAAIFKEGKYVLFSNDEISDLKVNTKQSSTGRFRHCLHQSHQDKIQEMIIGISSSSYCRPHSHPKGVSESYSIIEGILLVLFFDQNGSVSEKVTLSKESTRVLRINSSMIHMPLALSEVTIYHETLTGPFQKNEIVNYASWAPSEERTIEAQEYIEMLKKNYG